MTISSLTAASSSSSAFVPAAVKPDLFSARMIKELFQPLTKFLCTSEQLSLIRLNHQSYAKMDYVKKVTTSRQFPNDITLENLRLALNQLPQLRSINLKTPGGARIDNSTQFVSVALMDEITERFRNKKMNHVAFLDLESSRSRHESTPLVLNAVKKFIQTVELAPPQQLVIAEQWWMDLIDVTNIPLQTPGFSFPVAADDELIDLLIQKLDFSNLLSLDLQIVDLQIVSLTIQALKMLLTRLPLESMRHIALTGRPIDQESLKYIASRLTIHSSLQSIELEVNTVPAESIKMLLTALPLESMQRLSLYSSLSEQNKITINQGHIEYMTSRLAGKNSLKNIELEVNAVPAESFKMLLTALPLESMRHIAFKGSAITVENARYIASRIAINNSLEMVRIYLTDIDARKPAIICLLIDSLSSVAMRHVSIGTNNDHVQEQEGSAEIIAHLELKKPSWPNISFVSIKEDDFVVNSRWLDEMTDSELDELDQLDD